MSAETTRFSFATVIASAGYEVVIAAPSMPELAKAFRQFTGDKLDTSKVDRIEILPK